MRFRFSLRALFLPITAFAGFCYIWIAKPSAAAKRFAESTRAEDYESADQLFRRADDRVLTQWKEKYLGFQADAVILPWSFAQCLCGRREVQLHVTYFFLDEHHDVEMHLAATSFGIDPPSTSFTNNAPLVDRVQHSTLPQDIRR